MCDRSAPAEMPAGTPTRRCNLAWPRTGGPCAPLSVQKHAHLSCQFGENCQNWQYERMVISGEIRGPLFTTVCQFCLNWLPCTDALCRWANIPNIDDDNITVHNFYQAMAARYQIQREENFASWTFLCIPNHVFYVFCLKKGLSGFFPKCWSCSVEGVDEGGWPQQPKVFFLKVALLANASPSKLIRLPSGRYFCEQVANTLPNTLYPHWLNIGWRLLNDWLRILRYQISAHFTR